MRTMLMLVAVVVGAVGCGAPQDAKPECSGVASMTACPVGFDPTVRICATATGAAISGCEMPSGITCAAACAR
jgi:hypothetical protein